MGTVRSRASLRALSGLLTLLVAVTLLAAVGGTHRTGTRTSVSGGHGTAATATVRAIDHVVAAPQHAPTLDPAVLADELVAAAPVGRAHADAATSASLDRVAPVASGRGPPTA